MPTPKAYRLLGSEQRGHNTFIVKSGPTKANILINKEAIRKSL